MVPGKHSCSRCVFFLVAYRLYRQVFEVPQFHHFEPSLDALNLRSDVIRSIKTLSLLLAEREEEFDVGNFDLYSCICAHEGSPESGDIPA